MSSTLAFASMVILVAGCCTHRNHRLISFSINDGCHCQADGQLISQAELDATPHVQTMGRHRATEPATWDMQSRLDLSLAAPTDIVSTQTDFAVTDNRESSVLTDRADRSPNLADGVIATSDRLDGYLAVSDTQDPAYIAMPTDRSNRRTPTALDTLQPPATPPTVASDLDPAQSKVTPAMEIPKVAALPLPPKPAVVVAQPQPNFDDPQSNRFTPDLPLPSSPESRDLADTAAADSLETEVSTDAQAEPDFDIATTIPEPPASLDLNSADPSSDIEEDQPETNVSASQGTPLSDDQSADDQQTTDEASTNLVTERQADQDDSRGVILRARPVENQSYGITEKGQGNQLLNQDRTEEASDSPGTSDTSASSLEKSIRPVGSRMLLQTLPASESSLEAPAASVDPKFGLPLTDQVTFRELPDLQTTEPLMTANSTELTTVGLSGSSAVDRSSSSGMQLVVYRDHDGRLFLAPPTAQRIDDQGIAPIRKSPTHRLAPAQAAPQYYLPPQTILRLKARTPIGKPTVRPSVATILRRDTVIVDGTHLLQGADLKEGQIVGQIQPDGQPLIDYQKVREALKRLSPSNHQPPVHR